MTLILHGLNRGFAVHASDRRVSRSSGAAYSIDENKSLVVRTRDAIGVIGYTGDAYVWRKPMDNFLAESIYGQEFTMPFAIMGGGLDRITLNTVIQRIRSAISAANLPRTTSTLHLCFGGFRWRRNRMIPFYREFGQLHGGIVDRSELRPWRPNHREGFRQIGNVADPQIVANTFYFATRRTPRLSGLEVATTAFLQIIRSRARQVRTVGSDVMMIELIRNPNGSNTGIVRWRYWPETERALEGNDLDSVVFSPWFLGPNLTVAPMIGGEPSAARPRRLERSKR
jgi:hypothetical protein